MKIAGIDVAAHYIVVCVLDECVQNFDARDLYHETRFYTLAADRAGVQSLLKFDAQVAVFEPTGVNYSRFWLKHLQDAGTSIAQVGHKELRRFRETLDLPDKDDEADALALALYWMQHHGNGKRFVRNREPDIMRLREVVLRVEHCQREQNVVINRLRQDLCWQFPEAASVSLPSAAPAFWRWLAGKESNTKWQRRLEASPGAGISEELRQDAQRMLEIEARKSHYDSEMLALMQHPRFAPYRQVLEDFGMGKRTRAAIVSQIYPIEDFLDDNKQPIVSRRKGKISGNRTNRYISLRKFKKMLGLAPVREMSGTSVKKSKKAGSKFCRKVFWRWVFASVEVRRCRTTPILQELGEKLDKEKATKVPVQKARSRIAARAAAMLFYALVDAIQDDVESDKT